MGFVASPFPGAVFRFRLSGLDILYQSPLIYRGKGGDVHDTFKPVEETSMLEGGVVSADLGLRHSPKTPREPGPVAGSGCGESTSL
jgi:hypothetical protein